MKKAVLLIMFAICILSICITVAYAEGVDPLVMSYSSYRPNNKASLLGSIIGIALWSLIPGFIAKHKGRSFVGYYFLGFLITPLISTIVTICLSNLNKKTSKVPISVKQTDNKSDSSEAQNKIEPVRQLITPEYVPIKEVLEYSLQYQTIDGMVRYLKQKEFNVSDIEKPILEEAINSEPLLMRSKIQELINTLDESCIRKNEITVEDVEVGNNDSMITEYVELSDRYIEDNAYINKKTFAEEKNDSETVLEIINANQMEGREIVFCHKCGNRLKPDSVFCSFCGTKVIPSE